MRKKVLIIGGGPLGLSAALNLSKKGFQVKIIEASDQLMGLARTFDYNGIDIDVFYHFYYDNDFKAAFEFLSEIVPDFNKKTDIIWKDVSTETITDLGRVDFDKITHVVKLAGKSALRAIWGLFKLRILKVPLYLDKLKAVEWVFSEFGSSHAKQIWLPLLEGKFGNHKEKVSAYWLATRIKRHMSTKSALVSRSKFGYLKKTYSFYARKFEENFHKNNNKILMKETVKNIQFSGNKVLSVQTSRRKINVSDTVVCSTLPLAVLKEVVSDQKLKKNLSVFNTVGVVVCIITLSHKISDAYWTTVTRSDTEFNVIIQQNRLFKKLNEEIVYLSRYCNIKSDIYLSTNKCIEDKWIPSLLALYPDMQPSDILNVKVMRSPHAAPVPIKNSIYYLNKSNIKFDNFFYKGFENIYPEDRGVGNSAILGVKLGKEIEISYKNS